MFSIKRLRISQKLPVAIIALSLLSALSVAGVSFMSAKDIVYTQAEVRLQTITKAARYEVSDWFSGIKGDLTIEAKSPLVADAIKKFTVAWNQIEGNPAKALQDAYITRNPFPADEKEKYDFAADETPYTAAHAQYHRFFRSMVREKGYQDVFLFDMAGNLVYSVFKKADYATNFVTGPWARTDLGAAFRAAEAGNTTFSDFSPYAANNDAPASFISQAIYANDGAQIGVLAFQMPIDKLNKILNQAASEQQQIYLFAVGEDGLLRNDTIATPENDILGTSVETKRFAGEGLTHMVGLQGSDVYASDLSLDFLGTKWRIIATQDAEHLLAPVNLLRNAIIWPLLITLVIATIASLMISQTIVVPIRRLSKSVETVAKGNLTDAVSEQDRGDEIGSISQQLDKLRVNLTSAKAERERAACQTAELQASQSMVVERLSVGLGKLAEGDLSSRLHEPFAPENEKLREDFNRAMEQLQDFIHGIVGHVTTIKGGASELSRAADDLSQRTESQAATLEQTAAALEELSASVKSTADSADKANTYVTETQGNAGSSSAIVSETVDAMTKIKASSDQISQIIGVIDDIAFQTNLLALNAGVEAARAGDAGRGFAVVASEVRALAQRSSDAAKEIKELISNSSGHVDQGVELVGRTGTSLGEIMSMVENVSGLVSEITLAAREQSIGLIEVNTAISQLDQVTQQNAAMVEESTAATHDLRSEADELNQVTARFRVGGSQGDESKAAPTAPAPQAKVHATGGAPALAYVPDDIKDDWEDF